MNAKVGWTLAAAGAGGAAVFVTQMSNTAQDRRYKKTLQYMHDGRDKVQQTMANMHLTQTPATAKKTEVK